MSYIPFRDNPEIQPIGNDAVLRLQIGILVEDLEQRMLTAWHRSECGCPEGDSNPARCAGGYRWLSATDPEELVALLLADGWIDRDKVLGYSRQDVT